MIFFSIHILCHSHTNHFPSVLHGFYTLTQSCWDLHWKILPVFQYFNPFGAPFSIDTHLQIHKHCVDDSLFQFMLRLKNPCGKVDPGTYKCIIDDLSQKYGQQDLRATTRQAFQVRCVTRLIYM